MQHVIEQLKSLDLKKASDDEIKKILKSIGLIGGSVFKIHKGRAIYRSLRTEKDLLYSTKARISFNPNPDKYGRANLQNKPIFYGSLTTDLVQNQQIPTHGYLVNLLECSDIMIYDHLEGVEHYVIGMWIVKEEFEVHTIVDHLPANQLSQDMKDGMDHFFSTLPEEQAANFKIINQYLSDEFSKSVSNGREYEYKISANYTDIFIEQKLCGVKYASVKSGRQGFNVALSPVLFTSGMIELERIAYITVYKGKNKASLINWESSAEFSNGEPFKFYSVPGVTIPDDLLRIKLSEMGMLYLIDKKK